MQYTVTVKKKSPIHTLWRKQNLHKARLQDVLFTYNKQSGEYSAIGDFLNIGALMKNPSLIVTMSTEPAGEVKVDVPLPPANTFTEAPLKSKKKKGFFSRD